jgi:hypothetical protein
MATEYNNYPVPSGIAAPYVHLDIKALADAVDKDVPLVVDSYSDMLSLDPLTNLKVLVKNMSYRLYVYDGSDWKSASGLVFGHMGQTSGFVDASSEMDIPFSAAQSLRGGMTFNNTNDALVVPRDGLYQVTGQVYASGGDTGPCNGYPIANEGVLLGSVTRLWKEAVATDQCSSFVGTHYLHAGDSITLRVDFADGIYTWGTTGYNGSFLELFLLGD